jgi:hypothetical protein
MYKDAQLKHRHDRSLSAGMDSHINAGAEAHHRKVCSSLQDLVTVAVILVILRAVRVDVDGPPKFGHQVLIWHLAESHPSYHIAPSLIPARSGEVPDSFA